MNTLTSLPVIAAFTVAAIGAAGVAFIRLVTHMVCKPYRCPCCHKQVTHNE